jgi:hypothetical protein
MDWADAPAGSQSAPIDTAASAAHVFRTRAGRLPGIPGIGTLAISFSPGYSQLSGL